MNIVFEELKGRIEVEKIPEIDCKDAVMEKIDRVNNRKNISSLKRLAIYSTAAFTVILITLFSFWQAIKMVDNSGFFLVEQGKEIIENLKIKRVVANFGKGILDYIKAVISGVMEFILQLFK